MVKVFLGSFVCERQTILREVGVMVFGQKFRVGMGWKWVVVRPADTFMPPCILPSQAVSCLCFSVLHIFSDFSVFVNEVGNYPLGGHPTCIVQQAVTW